LKRWAILGKKERASQKRRFRTLLRGALEE